MASTQDQTWRNSHLILLRLRLGEGLLDFGGLAEIGIYLQRSFKLFLGQSEIACFLESHAKVIMIRRAVRAAFNGFLQRFDSGVISALLVVGPTESVRRIRQIG